jgi:hypothetical protein
LSAGPNAINSQFCFAIAADSPDIDEPISASIKIQFHPAGLPIMRAGAPHIRLEHPVVEIIATDITPLKRNLVVLAKDDPMSAAQEINMLAFGRVQCRFSRTLSPSVRPMKGECVMTNFRLAGAAALSLMLATPAMAMHHSYQHHSGQVVQDELPVEDALRLGYGTGCRAYPSGFAGLYGDGQYPGNVYDGDCAHLDLPPTTPFN